MTIANVTAGTTIDPAWGNSVADTVNGIQSGVVSTTTAAGGGVTITFPSAFTASPTLVVTVERTTSRQQAAHISTISASSATVIVTDNDAVLASTAVDLHWVAIGTLA